MQNPHLSLCLVSQRFPQKYLCVTDFLALFPQISWTPLSWFVIVAVVAIKRGFVFFCTEGRAMASPAQQVSIQSKLLSGRFPLGFSRWPSHGMKVVVHCKKRQKRGVPTFRGELGFRGSEQKVPLMELPCPPILASLPVQTCSKLTRKMDYSEKSISPSDNLIHQYKCPAQMKLEDAS